jgi:hypothetical protein
VVTIVLGCVVDPNSAGSGGGLTFGEAVSAAVTGALGGAAGFANTLTFGAFPTAGFDQDSVHTGQMIGRQTLAAEAGLLLGAGAAAITPSFVAAGTAGFYSTAGSSLTISGAASTIGAAGGYIMNSTAGGQVVSNITTWTSVNTPTFAPAINFVVNGAGSAMYAMQNGMASSAAFYTGTGSGFNWTYIERPILFLTGTQVFQLPPIP